MTVLHRAEEGWDKEEIEGRDAVLRLKCLEMEIPFAAIYERTAAWKVANPA